MLIRPATSADAAALAELSGQLGYPADAGSMHERLTLVRSAHAGEVFVAIDENGRVAGWTAHILEQEKSGRMIRPQSRYVGPAPQRDAA